MANHVLITPTSRVRVALYIQWLPRALGEPLADGKRTSLNPQGGFGDDGLGVADGDASR